MDYKTVLSSDNCVIIKDVKNFELDHIFECGQCFRWNKTEEGTYIGVALGKVIEVEKQGSDVLIYNATQEEFYSTWENYFDLKTDYSKIKTDIAKDPVMEKSVQFGTGIRLLRQDPFEIIMSFIISANNRIPMIKRAVDLISSKWGKPLTYKCKTYYSFPLPESLESCTVEDFESCGIGFRAKYIKDTVDKIISSTQENSGFGVYNPDIIYKLQDDQCFQALQGFSGIGPKVADCIMLFSMQKYSAFPVDVWVKRAMMHFYVAPDVSLKKIRDFARDRFGKYAGFSQQYLFYYARENNIKIN